MVKEKSSERVVDADGYRKRAACICVKSEEETEVRNYILFKPTRKNKSCEEIYFIFDEAKKKRQYAIIKLNSTHFVCYLSCDHYLKCIICIKINYKISLKMIIPTQFRFCSSAVHGSQNFGLYQAVEWNL